MKLYCDIRHLLISHFQTLVLVDDLSNKIHDYRARVDDTGVSGTSSSTSFSYSCLILRPHSRRENQ